MEIFYKSPFRKFVKKQTRPFQLVIEEKLFSVIARRGFEKDSYKHDEVFDEIRQAPFTLKEAAEYLEVAEITLRRWVKAGRLKHKTMGRSFFFDPDELKALKKNACFA